MSPELIVAFKAAVLGVVEGLTEFLPVSSTGHLIVASHILDYGSPEFDIAIQLGAILALTWAYRERLVQLLADTASRPAARLFVLKVLVAFLPAAIVGLLLHHVLETLFRPGVVASTLIVGGLVILVIDGPRRFRGLADLELITMKQALLIGFGQTLSMVPGVSRSGATIVTGLLVGLDRRAATDFSFLLALPTMYAATLYSLWKARAALAGEMGLGMAVGLLAAYVSALIVIHAFLRFVQTNSLRPFGWYRIVAGLAVLAWLFLA
ncbi:undecaprenyl-diphosphate phosphatase [Candidatus Binatia bacterium]|jgi:undecaprenyl-diphosphatase|nr:undecaprenyl-diphosphate phosphatase [Candidatus Binatia bacterium]